MCHKLLRDARFLAFLLRIDQDIGERTRLAGCRICGGVLHGAAYPRKPRGGPAELDPKFDRRLSFCCAKRDCRRRTTPPSVRFLGRRVYLGAVVVVISAMLHGVTPTRLDKLKELVGVSPRTVARWRDWWREAFTESAFWKANQGRFVPPAARERLPLSALERFAGAERDRLLLMLRFLAPITTTSGGPMAF